MVKRLNKEIKLGVYNDICMTYGSVNKVNPKVIYVNGRCYARMRDSSIDCKAVFKDVEDKIRDKIRFLFLDDVNFTQRFIFDFDIAVDEIGNDSPKLLTFEMFLRQPNDCVKGLKEMSSFMESRSKTLSRFINSTLCENGFTISSKKL